MAFNPITRVAGHVFVFASDGWQCIFDESGGPFSTRITIGADDQWDTWSPVYRFTMYETTSRRVRVATENDVEEQLRGDDGTLLRILANHRDIEPARWLDTVLLEVVPPAPAVSFRLRVHRHYFG